MVDAKPAISHGRTVKETSIERSPMIRALEEARFAADRGEVPVGAAIVEPRSRSILAAAGNRTRELRDVTAHAEIQVIRKASAQLGNERLDGLELYVTLEPCPMCAHAISLAHLSRLYFGAADPKGGGVEHGPKIYHQSTCHHRPDVYGGIDESLCAALLRDFFSVRR